MFLFFTDFSSFAKVGFTRFYYSAKIMLKNLSFTKYFYQSSLGYCPNGNLALVSNTKNLEEKDEMIQQLKITFPFSHIQRVNSEIGLNGKPLIESWFINGLANTETEHEVFINADILLESDFNMKIQTLHNDVKLLNSYKESILYVADRVDTPWKKL